MVPREGLEPSNLPPGTGTSVAIYQFSIGNIYGGHRSNRNSVDRANQPLSKRFPHLRVSVHILAEQVRLELTHPFLSPRFSRPTPLVLTRLTVPLKFYSGRYNQLRKYFLTYFKITCSYFRAMAKPVSQFFRIFEKLKMLSVFLYLCGLYRGSASAVMGIVYPDFLFPKCDIHMRKLWLK